MKGKPVNFAQASAKSRGLGFGGEIFADAANSVALAIVQSEEFEAVAQALAVANDGSYFDRIRSERERDIESYDFPGLEAAGQSGADTVLTHFGRTSPAIAEFSCLEHFDLQPDIDRETGKAPGELDFSARTMSRSSAGGLGGSRCGAGFFVSAHAAITRSASNRDISFLISMQRITRFERQLSGEFDH